MKSLLFTVILVLITSYSHAARILGVFPLPGKSHYILGSALMRALAENGHDVTVISAFGEKNPPKGQYRDIVLNELMEEKKKHQNQSNFFEMGHANPFVNVAFLTILLSDVAEPLLKSEKVQALIQSNEKFDAVITEQFFNDAQKSLAHHFDAIQIVFSAIGPSFWINPLVGNPSPLAYIPDVLLSKSAPLNFWDRMTNTLIYAMNTAIHHCFLYPKQNSFLKKYIPNGGDIHDVLYNASLVLLNSHSSLNQPVPHVPNMIDIGGFHIKPPKPLPADLQLFLDSATDGVIYFSMGSNLQSVDLPPKKRDIFLRTFSKLKQKVIWKWEEDELPGQPPNVKLGKWLPQQSILAHPNVKLFITHGGLLSTTETIYFGVPILAIPIFGDQNLNAQTAVGNGYGLVESYREMSEESLTSKINELLDNPVYNAKAKARSKIFHDRPVKPIDEALYWVDYVIRHKGAPHLRVAALDLPWYKYFLLDVIAFLVGIVSVSFILLKKVCKKLCSRKPKEQKIKKQ